MKKFLSLVLALVMTMSLVTVSAGAKEFKDDDKITYDEAVAVISAIGVVDGYSDGSFKPTDTLTRGAAAKIICNLILGPTTANALNATTAPFKDVPASNTFAGYITYCSQQGIISGYSDGTFRPSGTLTGYAFMKMLLGALGYDATIEGYTGANWSVNVAKQALGIDLDDGYVGSFNGTKAVNREEACLFAFNTLEATMVDYDSKVNVTAAGGTTVEIAGSDAKEEKQGSYKSYTGDKDDTTLQFCEKYFEDLKKDETNDDFGRPADTWKIKSAEIGTWANKSDLQETWTAKVTKEALYAAVGKNVVDDLEDGDADLTYWVDGYKTSVNRKNISDFMAKNNTAKINGDASDTGKGVLTEVYVDDDNNTTVVVIRTYVFQATEDYNSGKNKVRVAAAGDTDELNITLDDYDLDGDDFDISGVEEDDYLLITCTKGVGDSKYEVQTVEKAELVNGEIDAYSKGDDVTVEGKTYEYACTADKTVSDEIQSTGGTTSLVLDKYGYIIAVDDTVVSGNYVFIAETEKKLGSAVNAYAYFADGTSGEIALKKVAGSTSTQSLQAAAGWYTYSEDSSGKYTLSKVSGSYKQAFDMKMTATGKVLVSGNANLYTVGGKAVKANEKTVFVVVDDDGDVDVYTGISKAPDVTVNSLAGKSGYPMGYVYRDSSGFASYVFISVEDLDANVDATSEDDVYVFLTKSDSKKDNGTDTYEVFKAVVDGDETKISVDDVDSYKVMKLYTKVKTDNTTERITDMKEVDVEEADSTYAKIYFKDATVSFKDGVLSIDTDGKLFDKDGKAFLTDKVTYIVNKDSQLNLILDYSRGDDASKDKDVQDMMTKDGEGHEARGNISGSSLKSTLSGYTVSGYFYAITEDDYIVGSKIDNTTLDYLFLCVNEATPTKGAVAPVDPTAGEVTLSVATGDTVQVWADNGTRLIPGVATAFGTTFQVPANQAVIINGLSSLVGKSIVVGGKTYAVNSNGSVTVTLSKDAEIAGGYSGTVHTISVDGEIVDYADNATSINVANGTYLYDAKSGTNVVKVTNGTLSISQVNKDRAFYTAYQVTLAGTVSAALKDGTTVSTNDYVAKGETLVLTIPSDNNYKVNGAAATGTYEVVVSEDVVLTTYETKDDFEENVATALAPVGTKDELTGADIIPTKDGYQVTITGTSVSGTGVIDALNALLKDGYAVELKDNGSGREYTLTSSNAKTVLEKVVPTTDGEKASFEVTISSGEYTAAYTVNVSVALKETSDSQP